jgi:hypothetical protein
VDLGFRIIPELLYPNLVGNQLISDSARPFGYGLAEFNPILWPLATIIVGVRF